jgi:hypothetical protein
MIIDTKGRIKMQNLELVISPGFTLDELKSNPHFTDLISWGSDNNYVRYIIKHAIIEELPFFIFLVFYNSKISFISIKYSGLTGESPYEDVEEYKKQVDLTKKKHDEWLIQEHGSTKCTYLWGSIGSYLDDHTYMACIDIKYNPTETNIIKRFFNKLNN